MSNSEAKSCEVCGVEFTPKFHKNQRTCSTRCGVKIRHRLGFKDGLEYLSKTCEVCGGSFTVAPWLERQRMCSPECRALARRKSMKGRECPTCGKEFRVRPSNPKVYCSRECFRVTTKGVGHPRWVKDRVRVCQQCRCEFTGDNASERSKKFCSYACVVAWRREHGGPTSIPVGGRRQDVDGYVYVKVSMRVWKLEHRLVAERELGRDLTPDEIIHHRDGDKSHNDWGNLQVVTRSDHGKAHQEAARIGLHITAQLSTDGVRGAAHV